MSAVFGNVRGRIAAQARVEAMTRERFGLGPAAVVMAAELACQVPGCPPIETVVAFWDEDGVRYRFKVFKPIAAVDGDDIPFAFLKPALVDEEELGLACC